MEDKINETKAFHHDDCSQAFKIINEALKELKGNSKALKDYFDMQSQFSVYSPRNVLLIHKQFPTATQLKSLKDWEDANITLKTENPTIITILEPIKVDGANEDKTLTCRLKKMIDISETNAEPNARNYDKKLILQALLHECPIAVKVVDKLESGKICECNTDDKIFYVSRNNVDEKYIKAVSTELAKISLYENSEEIDEAKADCIGYMISKKYNISTKIDFLDEISQKYLNMDNRNIATDLTSMKEIFQDISSRMEEYLCEKKKEVKDKEHER